MSRIEDLFLEQCPLQTAWGDAAAARATVAPILANLGRVHSAAYDFVPTGSVIHGTASEPAIPLDILVHLRRQDSTATSPERALDEISKAASALGAKTRISGRGLVTVLPDSRELCLIPAVRREPPVGTVEFCVPDKSREHWIDAIPRAHAAAIGKLDEVERCAIRVFKTWNDDRLYRFQSFELEAFALAAFKSTYAAPHIPWKIKGLIDEAIDSLRTRFYHPLERLIQFEELHGEASRHMSSELAKARDSANSAWFLWESGGDAEFEAIVGYYARMFGLGEE